MSSRAGRRRLSASIALLLPLLGCGGAEPEPPPASGGGAYTTWRSYGGSADSMQYSALARIDRTNVRSLEPAWSYRAPAQVPRFAFNPLVVDDVMYVVGRDAAVVALDARTGAPVWSRSFAGTPAGRGFSYWQNADGSDRRLIFTIDSWLHAVDARTGAPIASFGAGGRIDLREGLPRAAEAEGVASGTPGRVFENLIILGSATGEEYDAPPGDVRAFDVLTGRLVWTFHTIPHPGELGYDTWPPDAWTRVGGTNAWGEISIDEARGIAYVPLGSPTYDFYGASRKGANLFGNCLVALDARTGQRRWHFQAVHHDLWDYDLATGPKLLTVRHDGRTVDVVAQVSKMGMVYVLERDTGRPLWPIEERPVPQSDVAGEESWPTQPFPSQPPPFARLRFGLDDLNPHLEAAEARALRADLQRLRNEGPFTPPSFGGSLQSPGQYGGAEWGAAAADPKSGRLFVHAVDLPVANVLSTARPSDFGRPSSETRYYGVYANVVRASGSLPAFAPPWSEIVAYDLNEGTIRWRVPAGTIPSLAARGITDTGSYLSTRNGLVVTAGGLVFTGSASDRTVRAYDADSGRVLWERELESNPQGTPAVYEVDGRQYVVFFAESSARGPESVWKRSPAEAQGYYAFALR